MALAGYMFGFATAYTAMSTATGALILFSAGSTGINLRLLRVWVW